VDAGRRVASRVSVGDATCVCCRVAAASGADGAVALAWRRIGASGARDMVVARSRDAGARFAPLVPVAVDDWRLDACPHRGGSLAFDASGVSWLAWYTEGGGRPTLRLATAAADGAFGAPRALHDDPASWPDRVALATARDGRALVAWEARTPVRSSIAMRWVDAASLGPVAVASQGLKAEGVALATAPDGRVVAAWLEESFPATRTVVAQLGDGPSS
jgi:hypothetical protein